MLNDDGKPTLSTTILGSGIHDQDDDSIIYIVFMNDVI